MSKKANTVANYTAALKGLSWGDTDEGFYEWIVVEAEYDCTKQHKIFKAFREKWLGKEKNIDKVMSNKKNGMKKEHFIRICVRMDA